MSTQENNSRKVIIPDQLNIIIRTSVPGFQKIEYKPSMTIKDIDEKGVKFNPLIKLNQSTIDKIPQEYRIKQFFNKGLFQSLLNYNGGTPAKNLLQATRNGYVDNNIKVTLNSIFPVGSVIYIGKKPYAIADHQWTKGDWKIEVKQKKEEIDPNKIRDPKLYSELVKDEIISGEEQLRQIPENIIVGENYSGPPIVQIKKTATAAAPSTNLPPAPTPVTSQVTTPVTTPATSPVTTLTTTSGPPSIEKKDLQVAVAPPVKPVGPPAVIKPVGPQAVIQPVEPPAVIQSVALPTKQTFTSTEKSEQVEFLSPEEEKLFETFKEDLQFSIKNTKFFKNYFKNQIYKNICKTIFNNFSSNLKRQIKAFYSYVTNSEPRIKVEGLSGELYNKLCDQVSIIKSPTDGDCFFKAVADGINIYNYENPDSKIINANYGKTLLYTTSIIREFVARYIESLGDEIINNMLLIAEEQVEPLNTKFTEAIEGLKLTLNIPEVTQEQYLSQLNNTYHSNSNFLIYNPEKIPINIEDYLKPFRVLEKKEVLSYIRSKNYWANDVAIEAICSKLNICIIPIEKYSYDKTSEKVRIKKSAVDRLKALILNKTLINEQCSNNVMFLFHENNHYELIRFIYITKPSIKIFGEGVRKLRVFEKKWYTIFKLRDLVPPFHILILIYGTIYSTLNEKSREDFLYETTMKAINSSVSKITTTQDWYLFKKEFDNMFPNKISIDKRIIQKDLQEEVQEEVQEEEDEDKNKEMITQKLITNPSTYNLNDIDGGGDVGNYKYRGNYTKPTYITKKPDDQGTSKIAYTITIDMELHPGTSLTPEQINQSKCNSRYNAIKKAFSEFTGKPYVIPPVYPESKNNTKKNLVQTKGGKRKTRKNIQ